jgi:hypothetical protein
MCDVLLYCVYCLCVNVWCTAVLCVLFVCKCVMCCCHRVSTQLRLNMCVSYTIPNWHAFYTLYQSHSPYTENLIRWRVQTTRLLTQLLAICLTHEALPCIHALLHGLLHRLVLCSYSSAIRLRPITLEVWVRSQASPCGVCGGKTALV